MRTLLYRMFILIAIFGLVFAPPVLSGYAEIGRAESALKTNDIANAAVAYERAALRLPWQAGLWEQAGQLQFKLGDYKKAITLLEKARQANSLSASGWEILGISYFGETGELDKAVETWKTGLERYPAYSKYFEHLVVAYYLQKDYASESDALARWVAGEGRNDAISHYRLGQLLAASEPERALQEFLQASSLDPEFESAVETMRTSLNLASLEADESRKFVIIGRGLGLVNQWDLAQRAFRQAVTADGENAEAWAWLGEAEQQLGQDGRAELDKALALGQKNPIVRSLRGLYWSRQGRGDKALAEYLLAAAYDPENPAWQVSIGEAYAQRGDLQAALNAYNRATELDPTDADLWRALATFSTRYNMQVEDVGLPAARKAVDLNGKDPLALDSLGWAQTLLERYDEARATLEQALELDPEISQIHLHLGIVLMQLQDWQTAASHLEKAYTLDATGPIGEQAQLLLNQYFP